jgi:tetratricopeptide (TPR) repeat protein
VQNILSRIIGLILFGTLSFSFSTAAAFSREAKPVASSSSSSDPVGAPEGQTAPASEPDLITNIRSLEVKVLGAAPESESIDDRLVAMEEKLFGKKSSGSLFERLIKITQALTPKMGGESEIKPTPLASAALPSVTPPMEVAAAKSKNTAAAPAAPSRAAQLNAAHQLFDEKNYKGARKLIETFISHNPLVYNGYYLLGLIDLKEHEPLPEYNQFAYNQFLKADNLATKSPDCDFVCRYVAQVVRAQRPLDPRSVAVSGKMNGVQALLNVGVNCFLRNDDADARDMFEFVLKYCPGGAASANYNLGAMAEKHGQLPQALTFYRTALTASYDRDALISYKMLKKNDFEVDALSQKLIRRTLQRIALKIKSNDHAWTGDDQEKGTAVGPRCTINRISPNSAWSDIFDAGDNQLQ